MSHITAQLLSEVDYPDIPSMRISIGAVNGISDGLNLHQRGISSFSSHLMHQKNIHCFLKISLVYDNISFRSLNYFKKQDGKNSGSIFLRGKQVFNSFCFNAR